MEIHINLWKSMEIHRNLLKSMEIHGPVLAVHCPSHRPVLSYSLGGIASETRTSLRFNDPLLTVSFGGLWVTREWLFSFSNTASRESLTKHCAWCATWACYRTAWSNAWKRYRKRGMSFPKGCATREPATTWTKPSRKHTRITSTKAEAGLHSTKAEAVSAQAANQ